jgi:hypothetical protein
VRILARFRSAIRRGTGEAHLIARAHPEVDFSDEIIAACVKTFVYDAQCEGSRAAYLNELIDLSINKPRIVEAVLDRLMVEDDDWWVLNQLFDSAALFAKDGNARARKTLYARYDADAPRCGEEAILILDGLEGLKYIISRRRRRPNVEPNDWEAASLLRQFQEMYPSVDAYAELSDVGKENPDFCGYLEEVRQNQADDETRQRKPRDRYSYESVRESIETSHRVFVTVRRAEELTPGEITNLANDFLCERDEQKLKSYLRLFSYVPFPFGYTPLLEFARGDRGVSLIPEGVDALSQFAGEDIRELALERIAVAADASSHTNLLIRNYRPGDGVLLTTAARRARGQECIHRLTRSYTDIFEANNTPECEAPLTACYDKLRCGICRKHIVLVLIANERLSERIREEIAFDSEPRTRLLATGRPGA